MSSQPRVTRPSSRILPALCASACVHLLLLRLPFPAIDAIEPGILQTVSHESWNRRSLHVVGVGNADGVVTQHALTAGLLREPGLSGVPVRAALRAPVPAAVRSSRPAATTPLMAPVERVVGDRSLITGQPVAAPVVDVAMEKATLRIRSELRSFNDSLVDIESRGRPSDWSYTDDNGKRWGISPGQIHINGHSLSPCKILLDPFTCQFRINDGVRQEQRARTELHREIQLQSARIEGDRQIRERLRAMESRRAAARDTLRRDRNNPS